MIWHAITWYDMRYDNHKIFMLSQLAFLENVSHYSLIRIFTIILWSFFGQINKCFTQFQVGDRLEALFGVSILEDTGKRAMSCGISGIKCHVWMSDLQIFDFYVWVHFAEENLEEKLYFLLDKWLWNLPKAYWSQVWNITVYII